MAEVVITTTSVVWTDEEQEIAGKVLDKITFCEQQKAQIGHFLAEKLIRAKKNISTEMVPFNEKGEVYLGQRDSLKENPDEPYPDLWHAWGATHNASEYMEDTLPRVEAKTKGGRLERVIEVFPETGFLPEVQDPPRGIYLQRVCIAMLTGDPASSKSRFFPQDEIPWDKLVGSHRTVVLPRALEAYHKHFNKGN